MQYHLLCDPDLAGHWAYHGRFYPEYAHVCAALAQMDLLVLCADLWCIPDLTFYREYIRFPECKKGGQ